MLQLEQHFILLPRTEPSVLVRDKQRDWHWRQILDVRTAYGVADAYDAYESYDACR